MKLPKNTKSIENSNLSVETLFSKQDASEELQRILDRNVELEEIMLALQPLLASLSVALYGDDDKPILIATLVDDACAFLNKRGGTLQ